MHKRTWHRWQAIALAASLAVPWAMAMPSASLALPSYKYPLFYGREFKGHSYPGHGWGLDIVSTSTGMTQGQEVLASAAGTVNYTDPGNGQINHDHGPSLARALETRGPVHPGSEQSSLEALKQGRDCNA